ncbi:DUF6355 family natural product biosynthesis protein [Allokutzneria sp. A3M-2-11 16]|uniref:DUF6355 family natural product biosynthesis protein n=1 Tax=Allokutzneria sp. A3M-2-11 16 TaxID=2962043 RepID=UPI0020B7FFBC|nr:DUF6355 family natural product biosynthesis protein [Allokutzneria sp. A3M-2-11 16]MCP3804732.1 DUF6355 family natural product biosynthesis protein [Allokutzneria sp. A3M-2-11 16]
MSFVRHAVAVLSITGAVLGMSVAVSGEASAAPCGYYKKVEEARYNHCGGGRVVIYVNTVLAPDYEKCVGRGDHYLGSVLQVRGAHYAGRTC